MAEGSLHLTRFDAEPIHSETNIYGSDFRFRHEKGSIERPRTYRVYGGMLRVGGALYETDASVGTFVRYSVARLFPSFPKDDSDEFLTGTFVMQEITVDLLKEKADLAVQELRGEVTRDSDEQEAINVLYREMRGDDILENLFEKRIKHTKLSEVSERYL